MLPNCEITSPGKQFLNTFIIDFVVCQFSQSCWKKGSTKSIGSTKRIKYLFNISPYLPQITVMDSPLEFSEKNGPKVDVAVYAHKRSHKMNGEESS